MENLIDSLPVELGQLTFLQDLTVKQLVGMLKKALVDEAPSVENEPLAIEEPPVEKVPSVNEEPAVEEEPEIIKKLPVEKVPSGYKEPQRKPAPTVIRKPKPYVYEDE